MFTTAAPPNRHFCSAIPFVVRRSRIKGIKLCRVRDRGRGLCARLREKSTAVAVEFAGITTNGRAHLSLNNKSINARPRAGGGDHDSLFSWISSPQTELKSRSAEKDCSIAVINRFTSDFQVRTAPTSNALRIPTPLPITGRGRDRRNSGTAMGAARILPHIRSRN